MRILYSAIDQQVPGSTGGSTHVTAVAEGLAALGHEVHALATPGREGAFPPGQSIGMRSVRRSAFVSCACCARARCWPSPTPSVPT